MSVVDVWHPYIFLECIHNESLQLAQALVDARTPPLLHDGLGGLQQKGSLDQLLTHL